MVSVPPAAPAASPRSVLRQRLLSMREAFAASPAALTASAQLHAHLSEVLDQLAPDCLGVYWPVRGEFNAAGVDSADREGTPFRAAFPLALPFAQRTPREMHYRRWNGQTPQGRDEFNIPACEGERVVPDVVLVPCVGYTADGFRLGYGGGFFDRFLAAHPHVTPVGVAWSHAQLSAAELSPEPHDQPLMLIVTEGGVVGG